MIGVPGRWLINSQSNSIRPARIGRNSESRTASVVHSCPVAVRSPTAFQSRATCDWLVNPASRPATASRSARCSAATCSLDTSGRP